MSNVYKRRPGYWGIISIPYEYVLEVLAGRIRIDAPDKVTVHEVYSNPLSRSLEIIISSEVEIPNVTFECYEGAEIYRSHLSWKMDGSMILGSI